MVPYLSRGVLELPLVRSTSMSYVLFCEKIPPKHSMANVKLVSKREREKRVSFDFISTKD
jgi:hypothetical protein